MSSRCPISLLLIAIPLAAQPPALPAPPLSNFSRYRRDIKIPSTGEACALLDSAVYAHAAPFLKDLRLYQSIDGAGPYEIPYVLTLNQPQPVESETVRVLNLGLEHHQIVFDLAMPPRDYTDVTLDLDAHNFLATATVTGRSTPAQTGGTRLGQFTLYDLSAQHLSRSTTLHLQESRFPILHIALSLSAAPGAPRLLPSSQILHGADVPPSREAQTLFTPSVSTSHILNQGHQTIARLDLPERVPVERVTIVLDPSFHQNFSRDLQLTARSLRQPSSPDEPEPPEQIQGTIRHVRLDESGREIREQQLSVPAVLGANLQSPATVEVAIDNGNDPPLPVTAVLLEMRQRRLCFSARATTGLTLFYGDPELSAPLYDYARLFSSSARSISATIGPEDRNPDYLRRADTRPFTERHPHLLWIALLISTCTLALVAFRTSTQPRRRRR